MKNPEELNFEKPDSKESEDFGFNPEQTPWEFIESLRETEDGKKMEKTKKPDENTLEEKSPATNRQIEREMSGEKHKVCWEGMTGNSGCSEYMPKEKAQKWMGMLQEEYPEPFYHHWLEAKKESANQKNN